MAIMSPHSLFISSVLRIKHEMMVHDNTIRLESKSGKTFDATTNAAAAAKSLQSCPTLCDPIDGSPPGSPVPEILQARTLKWVAIPFSNA